jgi:hypothetical protein
MKFPRLDQMRQSLTWGVTLLDVKRKKDLEFEPDAWHRFERAVDVVAKSPPQHRTKNRLKGKK